jgi:hypothetical protein
MTDAIMHIEAEMRFAGLHGQDHAPPKANESIISGNIRVTASEQSLSAFLLVVAFSAREPQASCQGNFRRSGFASDKIRTTAQRDRRMQAHPVGTFKDIAKKSQHVVAQCLIANLVLVSLTVGSYRLHLNLTRPPSSLLLSSRCYPAQGILFHQSSSPSSLLYA